MKDKIAWYFLGMLTASHALSTVVAEEKYVLEESFLKYFGVSFDEAMGPSKKYRPEFSSTRSDWTKIKSLYDYHVVNNPRYLQLPRIPKIIHQIWLGSPLPDRCKVLQKTWKKYHPDWEYRLWTEKEIDEFGLKNRRLYDLRGKI